MTDSEHTAPATRREPWMGVELRHLAALAAIAQTGTFRDAADELGYVQSAVSQQIAYLERVVGSRLIERSPGPGRVSLTSAGHVLVRHADGIVARLRAARADVEALDARRTGTVRVGVERIANQHVLPTAVAQLARIQPGATVIPMDVATNDARMDLVARGDLDVAFIDLPIHSGAFHACEARRGPYVLLTQASHPLALRSEPVELGDLAGLTLLASPAHLRPGLGPHLQTHSGSLDPPLSLVQSMVGDGQGHAIVPALAVDRELADIAAIDLGHLFPPHVLGLCWHRDRDLGGPVRGFIEIVQARRAIGGGFTVAA